MMNLKVLSTYLLLRAYFYCFAELTKKCYYILSYKN